MLTIIHGNDIAISRKKLFELKNQDSQSEIISMEGVKVTLTDLISACESVSLLAENKVVIIENFFKKGLTKDKKEAITYLSQLKSDSQIIIWEDSEIDKKVLAKYFTKNRIVTCNIPSNVFKFLDSIGMLSQSEIVKRFHELNKTYETEYIYVMILRQIRLLIIVSDRQVKEIPSLFSWQLSKLTNQTRYFNSISLISLYRQLYTLDYKIKLGLTPFTLSQLLDFFLLNL